jgi:hypothetical protein
MSLALVCLTACKKSNSDVAKPSIVGKWKHNKDDVFTYNATGKLILVDNPDYSKFDIYFQFNADGSGVANVETGGGTGKYTAVPLTYTLNGAALVLKINGSSETDQVTTLTATSLVIHAEYTNKDDSGNLLSTQKVDMYYTKY